MRVCVYVPLFVLVMFLRVCVTLMVIARH